MLLVLLEQRGVLRVKRKPDGCLDGTVFLISTNRKWNYGRFFTLLAASNLSLHVYDIFVLTCLGNCACVSVCVSVIRYVGCWPLNTANKVCSLSLVCVKMAWQNEFVFVCVSA